MSTGGRRGYFPKGAFCGKYQLTIQGKSGKLSISTTVPNETSGDPRKSGRFGVFGLQKQTLKGKKNYGYDPGILPEIRGGSGIQ